MEDGWIRQWWSEWRHAILCNDLDPKVRLASLLGKLTLDANHSIHV